jgi:cell division protease FtsH
VAGVVDEEVRRFIESSHDEAWEILVEHRKVLDDLVLALLERETLNKDELAEIFQPVHKRDERPIWLSSERRPISEQPPVLTPAERAARMNGHASTQPIEEHPATAVIEVPDGGTIDPGSHH